MPVNVNVSVDVVVSVDVDSNGIVNGSFGMEATVGSDRWTI